MIFYFYESIKRRYLIYLLSGIYYFSAATKSDQSVISKIRCDIDSCYELDRGRLTITANTGTRN